MSKPVAGTMPTVLEDFGDALVQGVEAGVDDIRPLVRDARKAAHTSLKNTPNQLPVLKEAGVVDAGAQGFVDLIDGIWRYLRSGRMPTGVEIAESERGARRCPRRTKVAHSIIGIAPSA
jgi:dihydroxyacetone kinase-like predicted kinase